MFVSGTFRAMRHLGSILLSLVLAPIIWLAAGVGLSKISEGFTTDPDYLAAFVGVLALGLAGLLYSVLMLARLSPLGPILAGLLYFGVSMWALANPESLANVLPQDILGVDGAGTAPAGGVAVLLAVPLLATVASPRRWRRYDRADAATHPTMYGSPASAPSSPYPNYPSPLPPPTYPGQPSYASSAEPDDTRPLPPGS
jgi:hypothetical protein